MEDVNFEQPSNPPRYESDEVLVLHDNATLALGDASERSHIVGKVPQRAQVVHGMVKCLGSRHSVPEKQAPGLEWWAPH